MPTEVSEYLDEQARQNTPIVKKLYLYNYAAHLQTIRIRIVYSVRKTRGPLLSPSLDAAAEATEIMT